MKPYNKDVLKDAANRLLFDMSEAEYDKLLSEFDIVTKQMQVIGENKEIDSVEPLVFPFECSTSYLRDDEPEEPLSREEALKNSPRRAAGQIKLPRVV